MSPLFHLRSWIARRTFQVGYPRILKHPVCTEALFKAVAAQPGEEILYIRNTNAIFVGAIAINQPEAHFVSLEPDERSFATALKQIRKSGVKNVQLVRLDEALRFPFADALFDKVISLMNLHTVAPEPRLAMASEMFRVLRRKGLLFAADLDTPMTLQEHSFMKVASFTLGAERIQPHVDGTWPNILTAAGFSRAKRVSTQSSDSLRIGVVRAQRR